MPHWSPMMKHRPQITIVEPTISTPAWRSASPKNLNTRPRNSSPSTRRQNFVMSPNDAIQSRGIASQPAGISVSPPRSLDHADFGVGGEQRLGEDVVEGE